MPPAILTEAQEAVLEAVKDIAPHATLGSIAQRIHRTPAVAQHTLDALTRRGFVTPELYVGSEVYFATPKGDRYR